jgi:malonate-semialdehyde dehydrogenase (acetylating)/methylmalonate-semialdehyde dehydrogenase
MQATNLQEAIQLVNINKYRNWTTIFIRSRTAAHIFQHEIDAGQLGSNIPIPVPFPFFSFHRIQGILCWRSELLWAGWCALLYID